MLGRVLGPSQCGSPRGRPVNKQLGIKDERQGNKTKALLPSLQFLRDLNYQQGGR